MSARHKRVYTYVNRQKCTNCADITAKWSLKHGKYYCKKCADNIYCYDSKTNEQTIAQSNNEIVDNGLYTREQVEEYVQTFRNKNKKLEEALIEKRKSLKEERTKTTNLQNRIKKMRVKFAKDRWNVETMEKQMEEAKILLRQERAKSEKLQQRINHLLSSKKKRIHIPGNNLQWKKKKIDKWSNNDILHWINSLNLDMEWNDKLMDEIKNCECIGKDIALLKNEQEVGESFDIEDNEELCKELFAKIKLLKSDGNEQGKGNGFAINIFSQGRYITLDQKMTANYSVKYVMELYKKQTGVAANINDIHFYCKLELLPPNRTLRQVNIIDDKHLITVKFGTNGAVRNNVAKKCVCGTFLKKKRLDECYNGSWIDISCDKCMRYISKIGDEYVYHCVKGQNIYHLSGYDICMDCANE